MRYIYLWLVFVLAVCGCDEIAPALLPNPASDTAEEMDIPVGFPDTLYVRVIYVEPRPPTAQETRYREKVAELDALFREVQTFFADELARHGYPRRTFSIRSDADGRIRVDRLMLEHELPFYQQPGAFQQLRDELSSSGLRPVIDYGSQINIGEGEITVWILDVPGLLADNMEYFCGVGNGLTLQGWVYISDNCLTAWLLAYELGRAFGLNLEPVTILLPADQKAIWLSNDDARVSGPSPTRLSRGEAGWLHYHPAFHGRVPIPANLGQGQWGVVYQAPALDYQPSNAAAGTYQFEFRFTAWFLDRQREPAGFAHGVLLSVDNSNNWDEHVLRYLDKDIDANVLRSLDKDTLQRQFWEGGIDYTVRFEAELPAPGDGFRLMLLQSDGEQDWIYMEYLDSGEFVSKNNGWILETRLVE